MCRARSDRYYYRCEWGAARLTRVLVGAAVEVGSSAVWSALDTATTSSLEKLRSATLENLTEAIASLTTPEQEDLRGHFPKRHVHFICSIAAAIGDACASIASATGDIAKQIGEAARKASGSTVLGKLASIVVAKWLDHVAPGVAQVKQIGLIADMVAVSACPAQQTKRPGVHSDVVKCAQRLERKVTQDLVKKMLSDPAAT